MLRSVVSRGGLRRFLILIYRKSPPLHLFRHHSTCTYGDRFLHLPPPSCPSKNLLHQLHTIIFTEVGSLDDMETRLNFLNTSPITPSLLTSILNSLTSESTEDDTTTKGSVFTTRRLLRFFYWSRRNGADPLPDETFNHFLRIVSTRKDFTALHLLLHDLRKENRDIDGETFALVSEALIKSGREVDAVRLFRDLDKTDNPSSSSLSKVTSIISALCEKGHAKKAEGVVWHHKNKLASTNQPDIYRHLLHGWCTHRNAGEARRVLGEMKAIGICPGLGSYNAYLRCVCDRNLRFNPSALVPEANLVLTEMRSSGVAPTAVSYNILLSCLGRVRRVKEACEVLDSMVGRIVNCAPDWVSYYLVARVLFLTERFVRGIRIVGQMIDSGLRPGARFYHDLIGILCGVERMDHALQVFGIMKTWCADDDNDVGPTYDLLVTKLCRNGEFDMGKNLWYEAVKKGVLLHCSIDLLDPSKVEVFKLRTKMDKLKQKETLKVAGSKDKVKRVIKKIQRDKRKFRASNT